MMSNDTTIRLAMRSERDRFLNTWLREFRPELFLKLRAGHTVDIAAGDRTIVARCYRFSPSGFHRFDEPVIVRDRAGSRTVEEVSDLAALLLKSQTHVPEAQIEDILYRIERSSAASVEHAIFQAAGTQGASPVQLEQSLWLGHPFHPLAKSVGGFSKTDTEAYAPERAARFQLRWFLVDRRHVAELKRDPQPVADMDQRLLAASGLSETDLGDDILFPCHPWQATRLEANPEFSNRIRGGQIRLTEARGDFAIPTSSVRTVWFPERNLFVKLPFEAIITNFSRVNTDEQIARSIAGADAIAIAGPAIGDAGLTVLDEPIGRILESRKTDGGVRHHPETGYLLRNAGFGAGTSPLVVAGLLETNPASGKANLAAVSGHHLREQENVRRWLEAYLRVSLMPLLRVFNDTGIALEAHSQNSLIRFVDGWPTHLFVRDLEGVAVDRHAFEQRFKDRAELLDEVLFYGRETAWRRLLYYVVVNHFSHVVATVAEISGVDEAELWVTARQVLEQFPDIAAAQELLAASTLPAKANLKSCLGGHGDAPSYIPIPNPFHARRTATSSDIQQSHLAEAIQ